MKKALFLLTATLFVFAMLPTYSIAQHANVYVIHGIPGADLGLDPELPVDISVNGACAITAFKFKEIAGPLPFEPGVYNIAISVANAENPCSNDPVIEAEVLIRPGENTTIIAHLTEDANITASKLVNDVSPTQNQKGRVMIHHLAAAPIVDAEFNKQDAGKAPIMNKAGNFINGDRASFEVKNGKWSLILSPWNTGTVVFKNLLNVKINRLYLVYAVGNISTGTFTLIKMIIKTKGR
jgi:hypothetical protein